MKENIQIQVAVSQGIEVEALEVNTTLNSLFYNLLY